MEYIRDGLLLPDNPEQSIDEATHDSFSDVKTDIPETYKQLTLSPDKKAAAISAWENGEDPDLTVDSIDRDQLIERSKMLRQWKAELVADESIDPDVKQIYRWRINEDIANTEMVIASNDGDMRRFQVWNEFVYGKPNAPIYKAALDWVAHDAEKILLYGNKYSQFAKDSANKVIELIGDNRGQRMLLPPSEDTFGKVRDDHMREGGYYDLLLDGVDVPDGKITPEIGDPIIEKVVGDNLQSDYAIEDASGASWGVNHTNGTIERPSKYNMPKERFVGLGLGHEIGSHLLERVNGSRGPIKLAVEGLNGYESANEGRAVIREQVQYDDIDDFNKTVRWRDIMRRHIAISYACAAGEKKVVDPENDKKYIHGRPSSDVYNFMNAIDTMYQAKISKDDDENTIREKAEKKTTDLLLRVLKGTNGKGGAYLKDKVYLEGNVACWLTAAQKGADAISAGDLGKFNINNPDHIRYMIKFGLLPEVG